MRCSLPRGHKNTVEESHEAVRIERMANMHHCGRCDKLTRWCSTVGAQTTYLCYNCRLTKGGAG